MRCTGVQLHAEPLDLLSYALHECATGVCDTAIRHERGASGAGGVRLYALCCRSRRRSMLSVASCHAGSMTTSEPFKTPHIGDQSALESPRLWRETRDWLVAETRTVRRAAMARRGAAHHAGRLGPRRHTRLSTSAGSRMVANDGEIFSKLQSYSDRLQHTA